MANTGIITVITPICLRYGPSVVFVCSLISFLTSLSPNMYYFFWQNFLHTYHTVCPYVRYIFHKYMVLSWLKRIIPVLSYQHLGKLLGFVCLSVRLLVHQICMISGMVSIPNTDNLNLFSMALTYIIDTDRFSFGGQQR